MCVYLELECSPPTVQQHADCSKLHLLYDWVYERVSVCAMGSHPILVPQVPPSRDPTQHQLYGK